ncbi:MAG: hypothetical protein SOW33_04565, partial [Sodaliphilus sp.]|nr:hypothetical protein [Sodaliphilus sp.]
ARLRSKKDAELRGNVQFFTTFPRSSALFLYWIYCSVEKYWGTETKTYKPLAFGEKPTLVGT